MALARKLYEQKCAMLAAAHAFARMVVQRKRFIARRRAQSQVAQWYRWISVQETYMARRLPDSYGICLTQFQPLPLIRIRLRVVVCNTYVISVSGTKLVTGRGTGPSPAALLCARLCWHRLQCRPVSLCRQFAFYFGIITLCVAQAKRRSFARIQRMVHKALVKNTIREFIIELDQACSDGDLAAAKRLINIETQPWVC